MEIVTFECPKCHSELFEGARFCTRCGCRLDEDGQQPVPRASRPPVAAPGFLGNTMPAPYPTASSVSDAVNRALLEQQAAAGAEVASPTPVAVPVALSPAIAAEPPRDMDASLREIDSGFGALAPQATNTTAPSKAPAAAGAGREQDASLRRQSTMAELSRDEVLRRARIKQSMKRAGLSGVDLSGAALEGVDFGRADLEGANLENAKLRGANLKSANLKGARLKGADLAQADLDKADLEGAQAEGANFEGANLSRASLEGANLNGAHLAQAKLSGAELVAAALERAVLKGADLSHAELTEAELGHADLTGANLSNANLQGAKLDGALLNGAQLEDADLRGASALGANFDGAGLERATLEGTILSGATLTGVDARRANFRGAKLDGAVLHGAKVGGASFAAAQAGGVLADWIDASDAGDGGTRLEKERAYAFLSGMPVRDESSNTRYFGRGDVLRDATLEFGMGSVIHIDSRFDNCTITLREGAELTIGEAGVLKNCSIMGQGKLVVHGRFFERQSPGIVGVRSLYVSSRGGIVGGVEQVADGTSFAFEPGCRLRMKILGPRLPQAAE